MVEISDSIRGKDIFIIQTGTKWVCVRLLLAFEYLMFISTFAPCLRQCM